MAYMMECGRQEVLPGWVKVMPCPKANEGWSWFEGKTLYITPDLVTPMPA